MRKSVLCFITVLLCAAELGAQTAAFTCTLRDQTAAIVAARTFLRVELKGCGGNQPTVPSVPAAVVPLAQNLAPNASGVVSTTLYKNDYISCGGSTAADYYALTLFRDGVPQPSSSHRITDVTGSSYDCSHTPITANPVVPAPAGDTTYLKLDFSNGPVTGAGLFTSAITFGNGIKLNGATSGTVTLQAASVAGSSIATLPANTGTLAETNLAQTWSAVQTYNDGDLQLAGASSGSTLLKASATAGGTATLPNNTGTVAETNLAQTWSGNQSNMALVTPTIGGGSVVGKVMKGSGTLAFTSIAAQFCQEISFTVTGAQVGDAAVASPASTLSSNTLSWSAFVVAPDALDVKVCNLSSGAVTPATVTWKGFVFE